MIFYKYAGDSGIKILEDLRLKITPPNEFNDPFEITPRSIFDRPLPVMLEEVKNKPQNFRGLYDDMKNAGAFNDTFAKFIDGLPQAINEDYIKYRKLMKRELANRDAKTLNNVSQQIGILCLSKLANGIPMWSHYANQHRGMVIGLDVEKIGGRCYSGMVKYRKQRATVNQFIARKSDAWLKQGFEMFFTKSIEWEREQEYRGMFPLRDLISLDRENSAGKDYFLDLSPNAIREIILGCRISEELKGNICRELQRRKRTFGHVRLFQCQRHKSRFELKIIPTSCQQPG